MALQSRHPTFSLTITLLPVTPGPCATWTAAESAAPRDADPVHQSHTCLTGSRYSKHFDAALQYHRYPDRDLVLNARYMLI